MSRFGSFSMAGNSLDATTSFGQESKEAELKQSSGITVRKGVQRNKVVQLRTDLSNWLLVP